VEYNCNRANSVRPTSVREFMVFARMKQFTTKCCLAVRTIRCVQNWPNVLRNYAVGRMGDSSAKDVQMEFRDGTRVVCDRRVPSISPVFEVLIDDAYRLRELARVFGGLPVNLVDVGAHVGSAALACNRVLILRSVICAEPSTVSAAYLRQNLIDNHVEASVVEAAVGAQPGYAYLREQQPGSCESQVDWAAVGEGDVSGRAIPVIAFEDLLAQAGDGPILVKMDCEGSEYPIIAGTAPEAWLPVRALLLEYHPVPGSDGWPRLDERLTALGLQMVWHEDSRFRSGLGTVCYVRPA